MLRFEALYALIVPDVCQREVFSAAYALKKTAQYARYFISQSGCEKIIANMVDSDPWEAESEHERGAIPTTWNLGLVTRGGAVLTVEIELKMQELTVVDYDCPY